MKEIGERKLWGGSRRVVQVQFKLYCTEFKNLQYSSKNYISLPCRQHIKNCIKDGGLDKLREKEKKNAQVMT